jgi:SLT domain-containing protein
MGAAQIAMIASQSVPAYAKGTKDHSGGFARVGDGGRPEMVILPSGEVWKTPAVDTFAYLPKGTEVLPDFKTALANMLSRPVMAVYDDNRGDTVFLHDEVLRRDTGEMRSRLDAIGRSVEAIRANSIYSERKAGVMYRLNRISRSSHGH